MSNNNKFKKRRWTESIFRLISRSSSRRSSGKGTSPRSREQGAERRTPTGLPSEVQGGAGLEGGGWRVEEGEVSQWSGCERRWDHLLGVGLTGGVAMGREGLAARRG